MTREYNKYIIRALDVSRELTILADEGERESRDDGCMVLYSVIRDCAYHIRARAERERDAHRLRGLWQDDNGLESETAHMTQGAQ